MKKSLLALAAMTATGAFAQSSVTLYGNIDVAYGSHKTSNLNGTTIGKTAGVMDGSYAGSRFGFRGEEDLGGGTKVGFTIEQGISSTSADGFNKRVASAGHQIDGLGTYSTGNNRQTFAAIVSPFGTTRIGYQYTNSYDLVAFNDLSRSEFQGGNFQNGGVLGGLSTHANGTRANAITYISPSMSGFTAKVQVGQGAGRQVAETTLAAGLNGSTVNNNSYRGLMVQYAAGPLYAALAHSRSTQVSSVVTGTGNVQNAFGVKSDGAANVNTGSRPQTSLHWGVSYDLGVAKLSYVGAKNEGAPASATAVSVTKANQIAVRIPVGNFELIGSNGGAKKTTGTTVNNDVSGTFMGFNYNLSKRTVAYAYWGSEKDKNVTTATAALNYKDSKTAFGLRHAF